MSSLVGQSSIPLLDSLWQSYHSEPTDTGRIRTLATLGLEYHSRDVDSAYLISRSAHQQALAIDFQLGIADALKSIAIVESVTGEYDASLAHLEEALAIYRDLDYPLGVNQCLNNLAGVYYRRGDYTGSIKELKKVYEFDLSQGNSSRLQGTLYNIGLLESAQGNRVAALKYYLQSLELSKSRRDTAGMALTYQGLGSLYMDINQFDQAEENYLAALDGYRRTGERVTEVYIYNSIGEMLLLQEKVDSALQVFQNGLDLAIKYDLDDQVAAFYLSIANLYRKKDLREAAEDFYAKSITIFRELKDKGGLAEALMEKGQCRLMTRRLQSAIEYGREALRLAEEIGDLETKLKSATILAEAYEEVSDEGRALRYLKKANVWRDSLEGFEKNIKLQELQMDYELQLADQESKLALLEKEKELQTMEAFSQRRWVMGLGTGLFVISILGFILFRLYRQKQSVNARLAENLHKLDSNKKELEEVNLNLRSTVQQLELTNNKLQQFAFAASHDLKESVRSITSFSQLLARQTPATQRRQHEYLDYIVNGGRRMQKTLNNLLQYNNLTFETKLEDTIDLRTVLNMVLSTLKKNPNYPSLTLEVGDLPPLKAERIQLEQLFFNLLENCLHYRTPSQPLLVDISYQLENDKGVFKVRDNGIGIPASYLERIFEPFFRLHDRDRSGSGLGLAICQRIVQIYGGTISAHIPKGGGILIKFTLPEAMVPREEKKEEPALAESK